MPSYGARPGGIEDFKRSRTGTSATKRIAIAISRFRERAGLTYEELGAAVYRSERSVRYWESGDVEPCLTDVCLVAAACGVRPSDILAGLDVVRVDELLRESRRKPKRRKRIASNFHGLYSAGEGPAQNLVENQGTPPVLSSPVVART